MSVQCTSPLFARRSFWCIIRTLEAAGFVVRPYQAEVPSFGVWGFALARSAPFEIPDSRRAGAEVSDDRNAARPVCPARRSGARRGGNQSARQPIARPLPRRGLEALGMIEKE